MATNKALKFIKVNHFSGEETVNPKFTSALATEAAIIYAPDVHEIWIGGATAAAAVCVVKGTSNVAFDSESKILSITTTAAGQQTTKTLNFSDVASGSATLKVFENVYGLIGSTPAEGVQTLDYSTTNYLKAGGKQDATHNYTNAAASLVAADIRLDEQIKRLDDAIGGSSVVNSIDSQSGVFTTGNGISSTNKVLDVVTTGYLTVGNSGVAIDSATVDSAYTTANTTNLATVASITAALNTLGVSTNTGAASVSGSSITIKAVQQENGLIKDGDTTTINLEGTYDASTNKIATQSTVTNAINALDVPSTGEGAITGMGAGKTIATLTETDGKIAATFQEISITSSQVSDIQDTYNSTDGKVISGKGVAAAIATLDTPSDVTIGSLSGTTLTINGVKEENGIVSATSTAQATVEFKSAPTSSNKVLTESDITGIVGAMVYQGTIGDSSATIQTLPEASSANKGHVYVVEAAGTYAGKACEVGDMIISNGTTWDVINGENQVTNGNATMVAGHGSAYTLATVDGTDITAQVNVTAGSATIATVADGVVTITPTVSQAANTGTIQAASGTSIVFAKAATTGAAGDVSITDNNNHFTTDTVQGAIDELYTKADGAVTDSQVNGASIVTNHVANLAVDGTYNASTNKVASVSTVTTAIDALNTQADVQAVAYTAADTTTGAKLTFKGVSETNGVIAQGTGATELQLALVATTGAASNLSVTSGTYGGSTNVTDAQSALDNLAGAISAAAITIDGQVGAITTGTGITTLTSDSKVIDINLDSSNANGLSVGNAGLAMAKATGSSFGTVQVTAGNGLTLNNGVVSYTHNTTAITVASKDTTTNVVTINGTLTPDASDTIATSNPITLAAVAATGNASDVATAAFTVGPAGQDTQTTISASNVQAMLQDIEARLYWDIYE